MKYTGLRHSINSFGICYEPQDYVININYKTKYNMLIRNSMLKL
jgi:hypothetical protein